MPTGFWFSVVSLCSGWHSIFSVPAGGDLSWGVILMRLPEEPVVEGSRKHECRQNIVNFISDFEFRVTLSSTVRPAKKFY